MPWKCQYLLCWRSMLRCVHSGTLSPKLENNQPNFLRSKYYVKNAHVEPFLGSERVPPIKSSWFLFLLSLARRPYIRTTSLQEIDFYVLLGVHVEISFCLEKIIYFLNFLNSFELFRQEIIKIISKINKKIKNQGIFLFFDFFNFFDYFNKKLRK